MLHFRSFAPSTVTPLIWICLVSIFLGSCVQVPLAVGEGPSRNSAASHAAKKKKKTKAPVIAISATPDQIASPQTATFVVTTSRIDRQRATTISYVMGGNAVGGMDYVLTDTTGRIVIPAGANRATINLTALTNSATVRTATMELQAGSAYRLSSAGTASVSIDDSTSPSPTPRPTPAQSIWIAVRTDGQSGTGTESDPYDGSTQEKFDGIMSNLQNLTNLGINLGPGTFRTSATKSWLVRPGWVIAGAGMYQTTIQLCGNVAGIHYGVSCLSSSPSFAMDNMVIRDLTCDSNWAELSITADDGEGGEKNIKTGAVVLWGSNNLLQRVRAINAYGSLANNQERFVMMLSAPSEHDGVNNVIQDCRVEAPAGNYGSPYAMFGRSPSYIADSKVVDCYAEGNAGGFAWSNPTIGFNTGGVNFGGVRNCRFERNTFVDCSGAAYIDTGPCDGVFILNNTVIRGNFGVGLAGWDPIKRNVTVAGNNILIQNRWAGSGCYAIAFGYGTTHNATVTNNTVTFDTSGAGLLNLWGVSALNVAGANISNNVIGLAPGTTVQNSVTGTGVSLSNNRTPDGLLVNGLNQ